MKTLILTITLFFSTQLFAQGKHERIEAMKVAFLTDYLDLTKKEAQDLWPIYNEFEKKRRELRFKRIEHRKDFDVDKLTEAEAKQLLEDTDKRILEEYKLNSQYIKDLLKVLPAKKVIKLKQAERNFKRRVLKEFRNRHGNREKK